jgi:hypothetical protein
MALEMEAEIIKLGDDRREFVIPSTSFNFSASTLVVILKDKSKVLEIVKKTTLLLSAVIRKRYGLVAEVEKLSLSGSMIKMSRFVHVCLREIHVKALHFRHFFHFKQ